MKAGPEDTVKEPIPKQQKKVNPHEQKIKELTELVQRVQAEFENYKKRVDRDQSEFAKTASKELIIRLLPVLDNFELALNNLDKENQVVKGFGLVFSELMDILQKQGLKVIEAEGLFNPHLHEALMQEESDKEDSAILDVFQKGYTLGGRVIRSTKVKVSRKKEDKKLADD